MNLMLDRLNPLWLEKNITVGRERPIALFDIDSTIMDTSPRNHRILQEAESTLKWLKGVSLEIGPEDLGWNLIDAVKECRLLTMEQEHQLVVYWRDRFFYDFWLSYDIPYKGVREILNWCVERKIKVVYLTGRDAPNMKSGTVESFEKHDLPTGDSVVFLFKPNQDVDDLGFKQESFETVKRMGSVVLAVENEPANANAMKASFPEAQVLLVDTVTAPHPAVPHPEVILVSSY